jgi:ligand-binding sensor domain-containing protein
MKKTSILALAVLVAAGIYGAFRMGQMNPTDNGSSAAAPDSTPLANADSGQTPYHTGASELPVADPDAAFSHFRVGESNVKSMLVDGNILWVGTSTGVIKYSMDADKFLVYDLKSGLLARGIFHVSKLRGRLAVGTYGGGLSLLKEGGEGWDTYNVPDGLADAFIYDLLDTESGDIWIATWSGANRVRGGLLDDPTAWDTYTVENTQGGLPNDWVYALAAGKNGEVWMATEGGLARFLNDEWTHWRHADGLGAPYELVKDQIAFKNDPADYSEHHARQKEEMNLQDVNVAFNPNYIVSLQIDDNGDVWCGTWGGGLSHFDGETWETFTVSDGLPSNHVFMLHQTADGTLWVGSSNGLAKMTDDGFERFGTEDGLFSNSVFSMAQAGDGSYWVGSYGGVAHLMSLGD